MAPEVFFSVCYGNKHPAQAIRDLHTFTPAILDDYCRHRVQSADYPAIVSAKGHKVRGVYVTGLTDANVVKLDDFEGDEYERIQVKVNLIKSGNDEKDEVVGECKETAVYVFLKPEDLEKREWDFEEFRQQKMGMWTRGDWSYEGECNNRDEPL